jgi:hypothetical protein
VTGGTQCADVVSVYDGGLILFSFVRSVKFIIDIKIHRLKEDVSELLSMIQERKA